MRRKTGAAFGIVALLQMSPALRLLDSLKSNLIATVSPRIENPHDQFAHGLARHARGNRRRLNPHQKEMLAIAHGESERLLNTLNNLLDLARFEEGLPLLYLEIATPAQLSQAAIEEVRPAALSKRLAIQTDIDETIPPLQVDRVRLTMYCQLLTNAIRHSAKGETILFRASKRDPQWSVSASPITAPNSRRISIPHLDKFFRVPGQPKTGTGLGLTIAKEFVTSLCPAIAYVNGRYVRTSTPRSRREHGYQFAVAYEVCE